MHANSREIRFSRIFSIDHAQIRVRACRACAGTSRPFSRRPASAVRSSPPGRSTLPIHRQPTPSHPLLRRPRRSILQPRRLRRAGGGRGGVALLPPRRCSGARCHCRILISLGRSHRCGTRCLAWHSQSYVSPEGASDSLDCLPTISVGKFTQLFLC